MIDGYTVTHSATEEYDAAGQAHTDLQAGPQSRLTPTDGRFLKFTIEAPLSILAVYTPQPARASMSGFWQQLTQCLTSHRQHTPNPLLGMGDFNALLLDELAAIPQADPRQDCRGG